MRIENILFKTHCFRLKYLPATVGIIVLFCCSPLWGSIPDLHQQPSPVLFSDHSKGPLTEYLCKRGSRDQNFQQWQDLSPKEQEKMRKKYREWQSLPPQQRKLYKQLFRQWQHLPPDERKQLKNDLDNWEHLSPRQQNSIRRRFKN
jgi:hypothetical protein